MSLPARADVFVNCVPANCMPSPESPQNRTVADTKSTTGLTGVFKLPGGIFRSS